MDTATRKAVTTPAEVDFDTRLALASAGMDALHAHNHGVTLAEAQSALHAAEEELLVTEDEPPLFQSHPVLKSAADLIRRYGWTQGTFGTPTTAMCAMGAIRTVVYGSTWFHQSFDDRETGPVVELMNRIAATTGRPLSVPEWNDTRSNADEVLKLLY